jgi:hypothetical protein
LEQSTTTKKVLSNSKQIELLNQKQSSLSNHDCAAVFMPAAQRQVIAPKNAYQLRPNPECPSL